MMRWLALVLSLAISPSLAWAAESEAARSARATATLISDRDAVATGHSVSVALRLRLAPGWHTYWRNPGDAGVPPQLDLTLPRGVTAGPIAWPAPALQREGPLVTYGYTGEVVLPVALNGIGPGGLDITAHAQWLVCANICVPEEAHFSLHLPPGPSIPSPEAKLFAASAAHVPRASPWAARIGPDGTLTVSGPELSPTVVRDARFYPDSFGFLTDAAPQPLAVRDGALELALKPGREFNATAALGGVLSLTDATGQTTSFSVNAAPGGPTAAVVTGLGEAAWLAFLAGLILNLMPCVFPILAMKALGLARLAAASRRDVALHAAAYTAGVLATFTALAMALIGLRAAGAATGWGFQFQSPTFVAVMAWVLLAVGLNFSGVFAVGLGPVGAGGSFASRGGTIGSFFTGLLAVLVATPCTVPFMAVAIGAALAAPPVATVAVFLAMGIGLAAPYVVLAAIPAVGRMLPRPGRWMELLRQALAFPMYGAAAWLLWVVSAQAGSDGVLLTAAGAVLVGFAAWTLRLAQMTGARRTAYVGAIAALAVAALLAARVDAAPGPSQAREAGTEAYSAARLTALRAAGRPVFVNMTAAWCVTCLVNERVALSPKAVRDAFAAHGIAYLKGDWTRQDADIGAFLREHGRDGVPLYVFYPAGNRTPDVLPQILTPGTVLSAISAG